MATSVVITVLDTEVSPQPIEGVIVTVYDSVDSVEQAQATTNSSGQAVFTLPGTTGSGITYEVRAFKLGVRFANPFGIQVQEPVVSTNTFNLTGLLLTLPASTDPRVCRCTGRFLGFDNKPLCGVMVRLFEKGDVGEQVPKIVDGNLISQSAVEYHTDKDGYVHIDLLRTGEYYVSFAGEEDVNWEILVPDQASVNLIDLMFPQPVTLTWDQTVAPGNAVSLAVGTTLSVPFTILFSDYEVGTRLGHWVRPPVAAQTGIVEVGPFEDPAGVWLSGLNPGTTTISVELQDHLFPIRVPTYSLNASPLTVTVTS